MHFAVPAHPPSLTAAHLCITPFPSKAFCFSQFALPFTQHWGWEPTSLNRASKHQRRLSSTFSSIFATLDHRKVFMGSYYCLQSPLLDVWQYSALQMAKQKKSAGDSWELHVFPLQGFIFSISVFKSFSFCENFLLSSTFANSSEPIPTELHRRQMQSLSSKCS